MEKIVFRINPDGTVLALSGSGGEETLGLRTLGRLTARRASDAYFDEANQPFGSALSLQGARRQPGD